MEKENSKGIFVYGKKTVTRVTDKAVLRIARQLTKDMIDIFRKNNLIVNENNTDNIL